MEPEQGTDWPKYQGRSRLNKDRTGTQVQLQVLPGRWTSRAGPRVCGQSGRRDGGEGAVRLGSGRPRAMRQGSAPPPVSSTWPPGLEAMEAIVLALSIPHLSPSPVNTAPTQPAVLSTSLPRSPLPWWRPPRPAPWRSAQVSSLPPSLHLAPAKPISALHLAQSSRSQLQTPTQPPYHHCLQLRN